MQFSSFGYGMLYIFSCVTLLILVIFFDWVFKRFSYRQGICIGLMITTITTVGDILFAFRINLAIGIPDWFFLPFTNLFEDFINMRYTVIAHGVINARISPESVEATVFAVLTGCSNLGFGMLGSFFGTYLAN